MAIEFELNDHIALITIDRRSKRNALDLRHWFDLAAAWRRFRDDDDAWVAVVTGVESSFCAGADLKTFIPLWLDAARSGVTEADGMPLDCALEGTLRSLDVYKPIVAAVNGVCIAGGMELLGGTDIRIASTDAVFAVSEPKRGLMAAGGTTSRLPRQLSWPAAMEILLTADPIDAQRAYELGLVNEVVPREELLEQALRWARRVAANAPLAAAATKESALRGFQASSFDRALELETEIAERLNRSEDAAEGPRAFAEKREPRWSGR